MVLCSHLEYPICDCVHSKFISPCETLLWNMSLVARTKQWTAPELNKNAVHTRTRCPLCCLSTRSRPCTWAPAPWPNFSVGSWKKGVFTLVPSVLKKGCVHISTQRVPYYRNVPRHQVWTLPYVYNIYNMYSATGTVPEYSGVGTCVHISAQQEPYKGTVPGH